MADITCATVSDRNSSMVSCTDGPHRPRWGDHRVEAEDRRVHRDAVDFLEVRNQRGHRTSHGYPGHGDRGRLRPQPSHERAHLGDDAHHARDVGQRVHVRIRRPLLAPHTVARLDRQRDVEAEFVLNASRTGEQQVDRLTLTGSVHPHQPRPAIVALAAQVNDSGRRSPETFGGQRPRQHRIVFERQLLVRQSSDAPTANRLHPQGFRFGVRLCHTERRQLLGRGLAGFHRALQPGWRRRQRHT